MKYVSRIACMLAIAGFAATIVPSTAAAGIVMEDKPNPGTKAGVIDPNDKRAKAGAISPNDQGSKSVLIGLNKTDAKPVLANPNDQGAEHGLISLPKQQKQ